MVLNLPLTHGTHHCVGGVVSHSGKPGTSSSYFWPPITSSPCASLSSPSLLALGHLYGPVQRMELLQLRTLHSSSPSFSIFTGLFLKWISSLPLFNGQLSLAGRGREEEEEKMHLCQARDVRGTAGSPPAHLATKTEHARDITD